MAKKVDTKSYSDQQNLIFLIDSAQKRNDMNKSRFDAIYKGLAVRDKKIYDVVPQSETWSISRIMEEYNRKYGSNAEKAIIASTLNHLIGSKLITEPTRGCFRKIPMKLNEETVKRTAKTPEKSVEALAPPQAATQSTPTPKPVNAASGKKDPIELMAELSVRIRYFADDLDAAALEIQQAFQDSESKSEKLKQLQALLKGISD